LAIITKTKKQKANKLYCTLRNQTKTKRILRKEYKGFIFEHYKTMTKYKFILANNGDNVSSNNDENQLRCVDATGRNLERDEDIKQCSRDANIESSDTVATVEAKRNLCK
jgi:hypothetical protein